MKKQMLFFVSLLLAYMSFGQILGSGCNNAIVLDHTLNIDKYKDSGKSEIWFKFNASTSYMKFVILDIPNSDITLYSGTCSNLNLLENNESSILYMSLTIGDEYFIKVVNNFTNPQSYKLLKALVGNDNTCVESTGDCDLIFNGSFNANAWDFGESQESDYGLQYTNAFADEFADSITGLPIWGSYVSGWNALCGSPDIFNDEDGGNPVLGFWARNNNLTPPFPELPHNNVCESAMTCVDLYPSELYILSYNFMASDASYNYMVHTRIATNDVDDEAEPDDYYIPDNINLGVIPSQEISLFSVTNLTWSTEPMYQVFDPNFEANRLFVYPTSNKAVLAGVANQEKVLIDDVKVTPIEYEDTVTCLTNITLPQNCAPEIYNATGLELLWTSTTDGAIISGETTLTPYINTMSNPLLKLRVRQTISGVAMDYFLNVQVTYDPINIVLDVTDETCTGAQDGAIDITLTGGGHPNYTYHWISSANNYDVTLTDAPATGGDIDQLSAGQYEIFVEDAIGCVDLMKIDVNADELQADLITDVPMFNNTCCALAQVDPTNGTGPYDWAWEGSNEYQGSGQTVDELCDGDYTYTLTDANNCILIEDFTLESLACPPYVPSVHWICSPGESVTLFATEQNPTWSTEETNQSITVGEAGIYYYTIEDHGCISCRRYYQVKEAEDFELWFEQDCVDDKNILIVAPEGFNTYSWSVYFEDQNGQSVNTGLPTSYSNNTNSISFYPPDYNQLYDNGIITRVKLVATNDDCTFTRKIIFPQVRTIGSSNLGSHTVIENNLIKNLWEDETPLGTFIPFNPDHYVNSIVRVYNNVEVKQNISFKNATVLSDTTAKFELDTNNIVLYFDFSIVRDNGCDNYWKGIELFGYADNAHVPELQPKVVVEHSHIKNAENALVSNDGGIMFAGKSKFENNGTSIRFNSYDGENLNESKIDRCEFVHNAEANLDLQLFVYLRPFPKMELVYNSFSNLDYNLGLMERGLAIEAKGVGNLVINGNNRFHRMTYALRVYYTDNLWLADNVFKDNYQGAYLVGIPNLTAYKNTFDDRFTAQSNDAFQMNVHDCLTPDISTNTFYYGTVGLYLSGINFDAYQNEDFQIYKNTFEGFHAYNNNLNGYPTALLTEDKQGAFSTNSGAEIKCNSFVRYDYAIAVMSGGLRGEHGSYNPILHTAPAGNQFYSDSGMPDGRFFVDPDANTGKYIYYEHTQSFASLQNFYTHFFDVDDPFVIPDPSNQIPFDESSCPNIEPQQSAMAPLMQTQVVVSSLSAELSTQEEVLLSKVDQGNTELLLSDIVLATDDNYTDLIVEIESIDSYLSDEAALEFMAKPTSRSVAKTIGLIANSPLPESAKAEIDQLDLSDDLKDLVRAHQVGASNREQDEQTIKQLKYQKNKLLKDVAQMANRDTTGVLFDTIVDYLSGRDEWKAREMAYLMLKNTNRKADALGLLSELRQDVPILFAEDTYDMDHYLDLLEWELSIDTLSDTLRMQEILSQQTYLEGLSANPSGRASVKAASFLIKAGLLTTEVAIQLPNPNTENRSVVEYVNNNRNVNLAGMKDFLEVYPNPVDDKLTVEYIMCNGLTARQLSVYDLNGKLLMSQSITKTMDIVELNVAHLPAGSYIVTFGNEGVASNSKKFIVQ